MLFLKLNFDVLTCPATAMHCMSAKFCVDSSGHLPFRLQTHDTHCHIQLPLAWANESWNKFILVEWNRQDLLLNELEPRQVIAVDLRWSSHQPLYLRHRAPCLHNSHHLLSLLHYIEKKLCPCEYAWCFLYISIPMFLCIRLWFFVCF